MVEEIIDLNSIRVENIVLGYGYTGVLLSNGEAGVCYSLSSEYNMESCGILDRAGCLTDEPVEDLLGYTCSWNILERGIGIAVLNALSQQIIKENPGDYPLLRRNLINVLDIEPGEIISMVGMIKPFVEPLKKQAGELYVLERSRSRPGWVYPDTACEEVLPRSDVVLITGSAIVNGTLDRLLELSCCARLVAVVGPTASMLPEPLFKRGVDYCGGIQVLDAELLMKILSQAGGTPQMKKRAVYFVTYYR